ncbi:hypothetical protein Tco_0611583 [Tanacetum coccineum]
MTESPLMDSGFVVPVFSLGDDPIACLNKAMDFLTTVASLRFPLTNNQLRTSSNPRNQATIQDGRVMVQQVQGRQGQSYSGTRYKSNATSSGGNNTEDLDTYDSDCDDLSNAQAVLMANISNYGSDVISESIPQQEMDAEQVFWLRISNPTRKPFDASLVKIEAPKELPKWKFLVNYLRHVQARLDLAPRLLQNRDAHIDYLKYTQEQADILRGIVKQAKAKQPLDNALDFACKHAKRIQELLVYVRDTCPNAIKLSAKKVESSKTSDSNTPVLSSTGLKCSTSNCGSKPTGNKKNDRISQTPSRNMKNKVEAQPRKVNKKNHVVEPIHDVDVKHSMLNANSKLICATCNKSMFDDIHDMCLLDLVKSVNGRSKSGCPDCSLVSGLQMFETYDREPLSAHELFQEAAAPRAVVLADSPVSTSIDQDAPSTSIPSTQEQEHSPNISQGFEESPKTPTFHDDPLHESLHENSTSQGSSSNVRQTHTPFEHLGRWTKDHPIANMVCIGYSLKDKNKAKTDKTKHGNGKSVKSQSQSQQVNDEADIEEIMGFESRYRPPSIIVTPIQEVVVPRAVVLADSLVSTSIDQDAPSTNSTSQGSSSNVRQIHTPFEHLGKWTKDHPIANVIGDPSRSVSTRKQLQTDAMWCYFDAFLTFVEPKNFKQSMTEPS